MKVSVVIPLFNRAALVAETLHSVLNQQDEHVHQIIVVDDGSSDGGADAVEAAFGGDVLVLRLGQNQGVQAARNAGLARCTGDWVVFCDSDDLWLPGFLAAARSLVAAQPDLEVVFSNFLHLRAGGPDPVSKFDLAPPGWWQQAGRVVLPEGWRFPAQQLVPLTFGWHPIFPSASLLSMAAIQRAGKFDVALRGRSAEDGEFYLRCMYGAPIGALPAAQVLIRKHEGNFSGSKLKNLVDEVWMMSRVRDLHPGASPFRGVIDEAIRQRRLDAAGAAFEVEDHAQFLALFAHIAPRDRSQKLWLKALVARLPGRAALIANRFLQGRRSGSAL